MPAKYQDSDSSDYEHDDEHPGTLKEKVKKERPNPGSQETFVIEGDPQPISHAPCEDLQPESLLDRGILTVLLFVARVLFLFLT